MTDLINILQLADSAFPTGSFSYSQGLEASFQQGHINGKRSFQDFVMCTLENAGSFSLPFVRTAHEKSNNIDEICRLDEFCDACLNNHIEKRASIRQGNALIVTSSQAFADDRFHYFKEAIEDERLRGHYVVMFGCTCAYLNINQKASLEIFMFGVLRTIMSSAVRLGTIGSLEGQRMQFEWQKLIPDIISRNIEKSPEDACLSFPLVDMIENTHDTLFSRLFHS
ncbi:uncharacterized protein LOC144451735 [Glandiceps talaboti]